MTEARNFDVYCISNAVDGRMYVGRTCNSKRRWQTHKGFARSGRGFDLHEAMRLHGLSVFSFAVVSTHGTMAEAEEAEAALIQRLHQEAPGKLYNRTSGGYDIPEVVAASVAARRAKREADPEGEFARLSEIAKRARASMSDETKRSLMARAHASMGVEAMRERGRRLKASLTKEQMRDIARKANATLGDAGRKERSRRAMETMGPEGLKARAQKTVAAKTPQQRSEAIRKGWATRRAKQSPS